MKNRVLIISTALAVVLTGIMCGPWMALLVAFAAATPYSMGNTSLCLGNNALGGLSGTLILQKALQMVFSKRPLLRMISTGFKELDGRVENANLNQTVTSRIHTVATVGAFGDAASDRADSDISASLTAMKQIYHKFTAAEVNSTDRNLIEESAEPIAVGLANHIIASVAALWKTDPYATEIVIAADRDYDTLLRPLKKALVDKGLEGRELFSLFNSTVYDELLGDPMVVSAMNNPDNQNAIREGKLPRILGMAVDQFAALPANGENLIGVAGARDSTVYLARAPKNPEVFAPNLKFPGVLGYVEDEVTGFRVMVNQWIGTDLTINNRIVWLEGYDEGVVNNLVRVVSA